MAKARLACLFIAAVALPALVSCDPCAGVGSCSVSPRVAVQGRIVDVVTGLAVPQTRVDLVAGVDSVHAFTDETGNFQLALPVAGGTAGANAQIEVSPPGLAAYRVQDLTLPVTTGLGQGTVLGAWSSRPLVNALAEFTFRGDPQTLVPDSPVEFRQTGGPPLTGDSIAPGGIFRTNVVGGYASFFGYNVFPRGLGDVVGDITVNLPAPYGLSTQKDVHLRNYYQFRPTGVVVPINVGPNLAYVYSVKRLSDSSAVTNAQVHFAWTGGIRVTPSSFALAADVNGEFVVPVRPLGVGVVTGTLTITDPRSGAVTMINPIQFATYDDAGNPRAGTLFVSP